MYKIESLFKHNIFFTPSDERTDDYSSNDKFSISITYISKIKDLRYLKLNIEGYQGGRKFVRSNRFFFILFIE